MKNQSPYWILILLFGMISGKAFCQSEPNALDSLKSGIQALKKEDVGKRYFEIAYKYLDYYPQKDSFRHYIKLTQQELKKYDDKNLAFNCYYHLGVLEYRSGNDTAALQLMDSADMVSQYTNDTILLTRLLYARGIMHNQKGDDEKFQKNLLKALDLSKKINNYELQNSCLVILSQKALQLALFDQQYEFLSKAYEIIDSLPDKSKLRLISQLASYHLHKLKREKDPKDDELAVKYLEEGKQLADRIGNLNLLTDHWMKYLQLKDTRGQIDEEYLEYANRILKNGKIMKDPFFIFRGQLFKGNALTELGRPTQALLLQDSILKYAKILNHPGNYKDAYNMLKYAAVESNKYKLAFDYNQQFIVYSDSLSKIDKAKAFAEAIQKYEVEKKEKEILRLSKEQQEAEFRSKQKDQKVKQNLLIAGLIVVSVLLLLVWNHFRQKDKLAKLKIESSQNEQKLLRSQMNPHFLFNSLNSIKRLYIDGRIEEANDFMADFGNLLRQILEQSSKSFISIEEELEFLSLYLDLEKRRFKKPLNYTINFDPDEFDFEDQIPSLILQPLVENSIWHGIMQSESDGEITITVEKVDEAIKCTVMDNGIGYFSGGKSKHHAYNSKGLKLVKDRIGKKGQFNIQSLFDSEGSVIGTLATLIFKPNHEMIS